MLISLLSLKLASALAKDMVNWEITKRVTSNLYYASKEFIISSLQNYELSQEQQQDRAAKSAEAPPQASTEYLVHNWLEALFAWFQMIILWHDPLISLCTISGLLSSFLLLIYFAPRFYATIMIAIFVYNLTKVWFRHIWPEIRVPPEDGRDEESRLDVDRWTYLHPHLMTLAELGQITSNLIEASEFYLNKLLALRREKPVTFSLAICSTLSCTAYIGSRIDGSTLIFCITTALISAPGIYLHLLPSAVKEYLRHQISSTKIFQSAQTIQSEPEPESSSLSPSLSLFEHLSRKSFITRQEPSLLVPDTTSASPTTSTGPVTMDVPISENQLQEQAKNTSSSNSNSGRQEEEETDSCCHGEPRKSSDGDLSSNGSTSLIDFEDDQQDGFVIL